ncbi:MAG TPA: endonuclease/exonuclease/phosphatase family protein [Microcella sp.]|nr:endonuclease/exonuclease/phosphatase family protein [Microcella sp.]
MVLKVISALALVAIGAVLLVVAWPSLFGLTLAPYVAQLVALRSLVAVVALIAAALSLIVAVAARRARRFAGAVAVMLVAFAGLNVAVQSVRGFGGAPVPEVAAEGEWTVVAWNTLGEAVEAELIAALALDEQADVVVLPETRAATAEEAAILMRDAGRPMWVYTVAFDEVAAARSTSVLVSAEIGEYRIDDSLGNTEVLPSVVLRPLDHDGPTIIGVHPVAPIPVQLDNWRADLAWLDEVCQGERIILAGDLNATPDHFAALGSAKGLGDCTSAAIANGSGAVGTWPTTLHPLLGAPIDHIMSTPDLPATSFEVLRGLDVGNSDHRPIVARIVVN